MSIKRLLLPALGGCLLLVVLAMGVVVLAETEVSGFMTNEAGRWLAPVGVVEASDAGAPTGAMAPPPPDPVLYEIDNPDGSPDYWVHWAPYTDAITYTLQEADSPAFVDPTTPYRGEMTGTMVTGQDGGTWYYRVRATTDGGNTPWSNVVSTTVKPAAPLLNPIANPDHNGNYLVDWEPVTGAITYTLEEDSSASFATPEVLYQGVLTLFAVTDQGFGSWFYRVKAENRGGESPWSNIEATDVWAFLHMPLVVSRWPPVPYTPELNPITDPDEDGAYQVSWVELPVRLADTYILQEATNPTFSADLRTVCTTPDQFCDVTGRQPGTYYYRVRGQNEWGTGDWSATQSIVVPPKLLINGDFEQGADVGWEESSTHGFPIILPADELPTGLYPRSGSWAAWLGGLPDELSLVAQEVTVQDGAPYLVYWYWIVSEDSCGHDFGGVVVNSATVVDVFDLCEAKNTNGWVRRSVNLSAYTGQTILFDIRTETNDSLFSNMFLDDVSMAASPTGVGAAPARMETFATEPKAWPG